MEKLPNLNTKRLYHTSCALDTNLYVFAGTTTIQQDFSIEQLKRANGPTSEMKNWLIFHYPPIQFEPRQMPIVYTLSQTEFLIMGGRSLTQPRRCYNDIMIFHTQSNSLKLLKRNNERDVGFFTRENQVEKITPSKLVAFAYNSNYTKGIVELDLGKTVVFRGAPKNLSNP